MGDEGTESDLAEQPEPFPAKPSGRKADFSSRWKVAHRKSVNTWRVSRYLLNRSPLYCLTRSQVQATVQGMPPGFCVGLQTGIVGVGSAVGELLFAVLPPT